MCSFAVAGSKLEGTWFEKVHIGQTQVPLFAGLLSDGGRWNALSIWDAGEAVALLDGVESKDSCLPWPGARLEGLGMSVIFAEDLRKPA